MIARKVESKGKVSDEGKTIAILSYITWIGWVIALILNMDKKNDFGKFHMRQSLLLWLGLLLGFIPFIGWIWAVFMIILLIIGFIGAVNGEKKEVPLLGPLAQDWFKGL